jgi:hypothetical protein
MFDSYERTCELAQFIKGKDARTRESRRYDRRV